MFAMFVMFGKINIEGQPSHPRQVPNLFQHSEHFKYLLKRPLGRRMFELLYLKQHFAGPIELGVPYNVSPESRHDHDNQNVQVQGVNGDNAGDTNDDE